MLALQARPAVGKKTTPYSSVIPMDGHTAHRRGARAPKRLLRKGGSFDSVLRPLEGTSPSPTGQARVAARRRPRRMGAEASRAIALRCLTSTLTLNEPTRDRPPGILHNHTSMMPTRVGKTEPQGRHTRLEAREGYPGEYIWKYSCVVTVCQNPLKAGVTQEGS